MSSNFSSPGFIVYRLLGGSKIIILHRDSSRAASSKPGHSHGCFCPNNCNNWWAAHRCTAVMLNIQASLMKSRVTMVRRTRGRRLDLPLCSAAVAVRHRCAIRALEVSGKLATAWAGSGRNCRAAGLILALRQPAGTAATNYGQGRGGGGRRRRPFSAVRPLFGVAAVGGLEA
jgi:hypothetical protein